MKPFLINRINGIDIFAVEDEGTIMIPIAPICQALGIDVKNQKEKIKENVILKTKWKVINSIGSDGKSREMISLPYRYIYGWMFSINPEKLIQESSEGMIKYLVECYDALFDYFERKSSKATAENMREIELLDYIKKLDASDKHNKSERKKAEKELAEIRQKRLIIEPSLFPEL